MRKLIQYIFFIPFALLYRCVIGIRYFLYNNGFKKKSQFKTPIISIGNITVGGTGKTPMVHFLSQELFKTYSKIAILSRGYGRKSKGFQLVHNGSKILLSPEISGDEPYLLANLLGNCIIAVDENRVRGIEKLEFFFNPDLIILDDSYQQLGIKKTVDIVLINASKPFSELKLLPFGFGREPINQLKRASIVIFTKTKEFKLPDWSIELKIECEYYTSKFDSEIWEYKNNHYKKVDNLPQDIFAFCGIADPNSFRLLLDKNGIKPIGLKVFKDHEPYSQKNMDILVQEISNNFTKNIITTEKDIVKLQDDFFENHHIFIMRINHVFEEKDSLIQQINSIIQEES